MIEPRISVIIPTRERCDVLEKSLQTVTTQNYDNLDIIVSDNFSRDSTEEIVRNTRDARIKYVNTGRRISMSHNWEFALSHVTTGWVTIIGDDDGLLPGSVKKVSEIIRSADVQAIRSSVCSYSWPSLTGREFGQLGIPLASGSEFRDSQMWLSKLLRGRAKYSDLPMLYNGGFVNIEVINSIKSQTGSVYLSCVPDVYSAVSISSVIGRYVYSNEPFALNGASRHSTGTAQFALGQKPESSPAQTFRSEGNIPFHKDIPLQDDGHYPSSIQAIVFESYLQSALLRTDAPVDMHKQQLELIVASAGRHSGSVGEWARKFAAAHGLDYKTIQSKAARLRTLARVRSIPARVYGAINTCHVGSSALPIKDVYEASIAAAAIRSLSPSRFNNIRRVTTRAVTGVVRT